MNIVSVVSRIIINLEIKKAMESPDPAKFNPNENLTKLTRFENRSLGYDVKYIHKMIKLTPGPADYHINDIKKSQTKNFAL